MGSLMSLLETLSLLVTGSVSGNVVGSWVSGTITDPSGCTVGVHDAVRLLGVPSFHRP